MLALRHICCTRLLLRFIDITSLEIPILEIGRLVIIVLLLEPDVNWRGWLEQRTTWFANSWLELRSRNVTFTKLALIIGLATVRRICVSLVLLVTILLLVCVVILSLLSRQHRLSRMRIARLRSHVMPILIQKFLRQRASSISVNLIASRWVIKIQPDSVILLTCCWDSLCDCWLN